MSFLSGSWLLVVFFVTLFHWVLTPKLRGWWIVAASAAFLGYFSPASLAILAALTVLYYYTAARKDSIGGKTLIGLILSTGGVLLGYKLYESVLVGAQVNFTPEVTTYIIPLGLSYYSFRCIHYAIEKYKGTIPAGKFGDFAQFMFFLPTFLVGPIHRYHDFQKDLDRKRWDPYMFAQGLERILYGYVKIMFLANFIANSTFSTWAVGFQIDSPHLYTYLMMLKSFMNLYFQFAGFSDVAIGFGMLLGFKVMENFNYPFLAANISDFWRRWHISLTSWCRDYVYMGVMSTARNAALAAASAMIVMGLWHECSIRFVIWGVYHGIGIIIWQQFQTTKPKLPQITNPFALRVLRVLSTVLTLHYFMFGMLIAENHDLSTTMGQWQSMLLFWR